MGRLDDGHSTTIAFTNYPDVLFYEKEVQPPGIEGGGANDTTTMLNTVWRTKSPKQLKSLKDSTFSAAYDTAVFDDIVAMCQENQLITVTFPDGSTLAFWGWLDDFAPGRLVEGEQPEAEITLVPSNQDADGNEIAPVRSA